MKKEKNSRYSVVISIASILIISILIKVVSFFPLWIEKNYSRGFYPIIASFFRLAFGWLPFSVGDILYAVAGFFLLFTFFKTVNIFRRGGFSTINYKKSLKNLFYTLAAIYIFFNIFWGLNYNRPGIAYQLGLAPTEQSDKELKHIAGLLLKKVNEKRLLLGKGNIVYPPHADVFRKASTAFSAAANTYPFLAYNHASVKKSMYGQMGNFLGFLGYYNPFTGEAQVNMTQPPFLIPFITCHEMAHQLGYANESEANFVGYLAAIHSTDTLFHYSAYFDLFNYANGQLFQRDSIAAKNNYRQLDTLVKRDQQELYNYWRKSDNAIEPLIRVFYDRYLKANQQTKGVKSYNEVVGWLISYYKKYGKI